MGENRGKRGRERKSGALFFLQGRAERKKKGERRRKCRHICLLSTPVNDSKWGRKKKGEEGEMNYSVPPTK